MPPAFHKTAATALIAEVNARAMDEAAAPGDLDDLVDAVVADPGESFLLLKALRQWREDDMPILMARLLGDRMRRLKSLETYQKDLEEVALQGVVALPAALVVGVAVGVLARTITGPIGPFLILVAAAAIGILAVVRWWIRTGLRALSLQREATGDLVRAVEDLVRNRPDA